MAEASLACRLVSLMPFASDCFQPGPVNSHDPGASRQARLWFYGADSPHQPQTTMSNSNWVRTQLMETYTIFVSNQRGALNPHGSAARLTAWRGGFYFCGGVADPRIPSFRG